MNDGPADDVALNAPSPVVCWSDRLELGEGIRWVDGRIVLVDILSGPLFAAPPGDPDRTGPLDVLARLPFSLGAVAPVEVRPRTWVAAAGTGSCPIGPDGSTRWLSRVEVPGVPVASYRPGPGEGA